MKIVFAIYLVLSLIMSSIALLNTLSVYDLFLKNITGRKKLDDDLIKKYAPNVVEGTKKLAEWHKNL